MNQVESCVPRTLRARAATPSIKPWMPPERVITPTMASMKTTKPINSMRSTATNSVQKNLLKTSSKPVQRLARMLLPLPSWSRKDPVRTPRKSAISGRRNRMASATATSGGRIVLLLGARQNRVALRFSPLKPPFG